MAAVRDIRIVDNEELLAGEAAESFIRAAAKIRDHPFRVALSGGSTPTRLYHRLAGDNCAGRVEWSRVAFYFGDERCVPADHPESNFKLAHDTLFHPLGIKPTQIFRMEGEAGQPDLAARRYEETIRRHFAMPSPGWPRFDLIFLGLGDDGHTASLFPGTPALRETIRGVVASDSPRGVRHRLTFTAPLINHAQTIIFLAAGKHKASSVHAVLEDDTADPTRYPAKLIQPLKGHFMWYLDRAAADQLTILSRR